MMLLPSAAFLIKASSSTAILSEDADLFLDRYVLVQVHFKVVYKLLHRMKRRAQVCCVDRYANPHRRQNTYKLPEKRRLVRIFVLIKFLCQVNKIPLERKEAVSTDGRKSFLSPLKSHIRTSSSFPGHNQNTNVSSDATKARVK